MRRPQRYNEVELGTHAHITSMVGVNSRLSGPLLMICRQSVLTATTSSIKFGEPSAVRSTANLPDPASSLLAALQPIRRCRRC